MDDLSLLYAFDPYFLEETFPNEVALPAFIKESLGITGACDTSTIVKQFYLGSAGTGSPLHFHEDAFNMLVYGIKFWRLLSPADAVYSTNHPLLHRSSPLYGAFQKTRQSKGEGDVGIGSSERERERDLNGNGTSDGGRPAGIHCVQYPGEMVYVPRMWAHSTVNLAETIGFAIEFDGPSCTTPTKCTHTII